MNQPKIFKTIILGIIILVMAIAVISSIGSNQKNRQKDSIKVTIDFGNGKIRRFVGEGVESSNNVWDVLQQISAVAKISIEVGLGFVPQAINGQKNEKSGKKWVGYLNGAKINSNPIDLEVKAGDEIIYRFNEKTK